MGAHESQEHAEERYDPMEQDGNRPAECNDGRHGNGHRGFDGPESTSNLPFIHLFRSDSVDVNNDPRIFTDNVITRRLNAFETVVVAAVLLASISCTTLLSLEDREEDWLEYVALSGMTLVFVMNLFCVLVVTQQYYQIYRLITAGPIGFEIAKSFYLNTNIMTLRHLATGCFFYSIPIFIISTGAMMAVKVGQHTRKGLILLIAMSVVSFIVYAIARKHALIFKEKCSLAKRHESPLSQHLEQFRYTGSGPGGEGATAM